MFFLIVNAVLSAVFLALVVVPPLYIYNPNTYPGESNGPPTAGEVIPDEVVTHGVKQKLYLLFIIPACGAANALFLYFTYYRPIRFIHYRVELNLLTLRMTLEAGRQQLQKSGMVAVGNRSFVAGGTSGPGFSGGASTSFVMNSSVVSPRLPRVSARSIHFDQGAKASQKLANTVNSEWRRHARPKSVRKDAWVGSVMFAEISDLRDEVERHFLTEGNVANSNFTKAVIKVVGTFLPSSSAPALPGQLKTAAEAQEGNFYLSSRPPLSALGAPSKAGHSSNNHNRNDPPSHFASEGAVPPQREDSVLLVPTESAHRGHRRGSSVPVNAHGGRRGSNFRFLRGGAHEAAVPGSGGNERSGSSATAPAASSRGTGNYVERRHEPVDVDVSPNELGQTERGRAASGASADAGTGGFMSRLWGRVGGGRGGGGADAAGGAARTGGA